MAAFFTQLLNDNGFEAVYHIRNGHKNNVQFAHLLDVPVGADGEQFKFSYHAESLPFEINDKNFMDTAIKKFKEWSGYKGDLKIKTNYVPVKFKVDDSIAPYDVVIVSTCGAFAQGTKSWPHFAELKKMLDRQKISYMDLGEMPFDWTNNPELLHKINNWLYKCKVFIGLDTGATHYATGILAKKQKKEANFVLQSGFSTFNHWALQYGDLFTPIQVEVECRPCVLPYPTEKYSIPSGLNLLDHCPNNHKCMRALRPETVFELVVKHI